MLVTLALSTMFPTTENIATALLDQFPTQLRPYKFFVTAAVCFVLFILGLPLCTPAGIYILQLVGCLAYAFFCLKAFSSTDGLLCRRLCAAYIRLY